MDKGGCGDYLTNDLLCSFQGRAVNVLTSAVGFFITLELLWNLLHIIFMTYLNFLWVPRSNGYYNSRLIYGIIIIWKAVKQVERKRELSSGFCLMSFLLLILS